MFVVCSAACVVLCRAVRTSPGRLLREARYGSIPANYWRYNEEHAVSGALVRCVIHSWYTALVLRLLRSANGAPGSRDTRRRRAALKNTSVSTPTHKVIHMSKHIDKNTTLLWGHRPMHVDIIPPKYHPLRANPNKFITAYRTRTSMLHADAAAWTSTD